MGQPSQVTEYSKIRCFYFPVLRFCPIFDILFIMSSSTRIDHSTICCSLLRVMLYIDPPMYVFITYI